MYIVAAIFLFVILGVLGTIIYEATTGIIKYWKNHNKKTPEELVEELNEKGVIKK